MGRRQYTEQAGSMKKQQSSRVGLRCIATFAFRQVELMQRLSSVSQQSTIHLKQAIRRLSGQRDLVFGEDKWKKKVESSQYLSCWYCHRCQRKRGRRKSPVGHHASHLSDSSLKSLPLSPQPARIEWDETRKKNKKKPREHSTVSMKRPDRSIAMKTRK